MKPKPSPENSAFEPTATRASSLWPASTRPAAAASSQFMRTGFEPAASEAEQQAAQALDVCRSALALRVLLFVQLVLATGVLVTHGAARGPWWAAHAAAAFSGLVATLLWLVLVCTARVRMARLSAPARAAALLLGGAAAAVLAWAPLPALGLLASAGPAQGLGVALCGALLAGAAGLWLALRAQLWQPAQARVRLAELQQRIRPHFLFNALNTAIALVRVNPEQAEAVLADLAELFRVALSEGGAAVSLNEEVELAQRYLAIEQLRYGHRMQVRWDIDPRAGHALLPPLVLQPLVENAVRHGVEPSSQTAMLWVQASARRGQAVLEVRNTLPEQQSDAGHGMAQANVAERLRLLHDLGGQFEAWREAGLYRARITVPLP